MNSLGDYTIIARNYNNTNTISYSIPETLDKDGQHTVIDQQGMQVIIETLANQVLSIVFEVQDKDFSKYPGTFQGFEFGMNWHGTPSYISSFIHAKNNIGQAFVSEGFARYTAQVKDDNSLVVTLTPGN